MEVQETQFLQTQVFLGSPQATYISYLCFSLADSWFWNEMEIRKEEDDVVLSHSQYTLVFSLNIVFQSSCQSSSMEEEEKNQLANISRFPAGHQMLSRIGQKYLIKKTRFTGVFTLLKKNLNLEVSQS